MNKKLFDFRLFKEGIRQSRLVGLIGLITIAAFTLLILLGVAVDDAFSVNITNYYFYGLGAVLIIQHCVFSPIMVLYLFRFLNKRNASDFYHAIPHKRETVHLSYFASIMFWNIVTTLSVTAVVLLGVLISPYTHLHWFSILPYLWNMLAAQFMVAASVLLAMSITGTAFSNLLVSLMIIFIPRILLTVMTDMVQNACVVANVGKQFAFLDPSLNVAAGLPISLVTEILNGYGEPMRCLNDPVCGLYTVMLGVIYFAAAMVMLHYRKSETATNSSPARWLQAVYRISLGTVLCLPAVVILFNAINRKNTVDFFTWVGIFAFIFGAALFYFLFELIATRKPKNLLTAIPGFFIVLGLGGIILLSCFGLGRTILSYSPEAEDINYITISLDENNYFMTKASKIQLEDPRAKEIAAQGLEDTIVKVKNDVLRHSRYNYSYNFYNYFSGEEGVVTLQVGFNTNTGTRYRKVQLSQIDYNELINILENDADYKQCFYDFPPASSMADIYFAYSKSNFTVAEQELLYDLFVSEAKAMPFSDWHNIAVGNAETMYDSIGHIILAPILDNKEYHISFNIQEHQFPKTSAALCQIANQDHDQTLADVTSLLRQIEQKGLSTKNEQSTGTEYAHLWCEIIYPKGYSIYDFDVSDTPLVLTLLEECEPYTGQEDWVAIQVQVYYFNDQGKPVERDYTLFTAVPEEVIAPYMISYE